MWKSLAAVGISPAAQHAAHVTLAILPDDAPVAELRSVLASIASGLAPVPIKLCGFGLFPGPPAILWLATVVTPALLALHSELQAACAELEPHPHTRPGAWVPHFTLADNLQDAGPALAAALPAWQPRAGQFEHLELLRFHPVELLEDWRLLI